MDKSQKNLKNRQSGPPHPKITGIHEKKEVLEKMSFHFTTEAGDVDPTVSNLEDVDFENLPVKTVGPAYINLQRAVHMGQRTFAEWIERDMINAYTLSPESALSPLFLGASPKMGMFLN